MRGNTKNEAISKFYNEILQYIWWIEGNTKTSIPQTDTIIVQEKESSLQICDADTEVIFDSEREILT